MTKKIGVIWNPMAGSADRASAVKQELENRSDVLLMETTVDRGAQPLAMELADRAVEQLVVAGGDGTVAAAARALIDSANPPTLAILPIGTANDLARSLGVPLNPEQAIELLTIGHTERLDALLFRREAEEEPSYCFNVTSGGNSGRIHEVLTDEMKQAWGAWGYLRGAVELVSNLVTYRVQISVDDGPPETLSALNLILANGRYAGGGLSVAPLAKLNDGLMDIILVRDSPPLDIAAVAAKFSLGGYLDSEQVFFRQARKVTIHSDPPMPISLDGEPEEFRSMTMTTQSSALRVLVGHGEQG